MSRIKCPKCGAEGKEKRWGTCSSHSKWFDSLTFFEKEEFIEESKKRILAKRAPLGKCIKKNCNKPGIAVTQFPMMFVCTKCGYTELKQIVR